MPISDSPSDLLKSWGECDGHMHGYSAGLFIWATVYLIVITDVGTCATHRSCLRHIYICSTNDGKDVC